MNRFSVPKTVYMSVVILFLLLLASEKEENQIHIYIMEKQVVVNSYIGDYCFIIQDYTLTS